MKKIFPIAITIILLTTIAIATHTPNVSVTPIEAQLGSEVEFKVLVKNQGGDDITNFEITLPESDNKPLYLVKEIGKPAGWDFKDTYKLGSSYPYKISWSTAGLGIAEGKSLEFSFKAQVPSTLSEFTWAWKTVDRNGAAVTDDLVTRTILAPFAAFRLTLPQSVKAGEYFKVTVTAIDKDGKIKTDYIGSVSFASSDKLAILPADYTYRSSDKGSREFTFKFKTAGSQTFTVKSGAVSLTSSSIIVNPTDAVAVELSPDNSKVALNDAIEFKIMAEDVFGNAFDVTPKCLLSIDTEAKGTWVGKFYKSEVEGTWTVVANCNNIDSKVLIDGTTLTVTKAGEGAEEPTEILIGKMNIVLPDEISVGDGESATVNLTVKNTGTVDLTDVTVSMSGVPEEWIKISPFLADVAAGGSYDYSLTISVPENTSGEKIIKFSTTSSENVTASKSMNLIVGEPAKGITALIIAIITKPLYLGILVVIVIIIVLVIWSLLPKGKKKKSEE